MRTKTKEMNHEKCQLELPRKEKLLDSALEDNANALTTLDSLHTTWYSLLWKLLFSTDSIDHRVSHYYRKYDLPNLEEQTQ